MKNIIFFASFFLSINSSFALHLQYEYQTLFVLEKVVTQKLVSLFDSYDPDNGSGIIVKGTPSEFLIATEILGRRPPTSWPKESQGCDTVLCALSRQFKNEESAMRAIILAKKYGVHISLGQEKNNINYVNQPDIIWSLAEIKTIEEVYRDIPETLSRMDQFRTFYRLNGNIGGKSNIPAEATPNGNQGYIILGDATFDEPSRANLEIVKDPYVWSKLTILHEICHQYDFYGRFNTRKQINLSEQAEFGFYQYSWIHTNVDYAKRLYVLRLDSEEYCQIVDLKDGKAICSDKPTYVEPQLSSGGYFSFNSFNHRLNNQYNEAGDLINWYANSRVFEDFAESCSHYRYAPEAMKKIKTLPSLPVDIYGGYKHPNRYEFMKNEVFNGVEY